MDLVQSIQNKRDVLTCMKKKVSLFQASCIFFHFVSWNRQFRTNSQFHIKSKECGGDKLMLLVKSLVSPCLRCVYNIL